MHTVCRGGPVQTWPLEVKERCQAAARWLKWERGRLWVNDIVGEREVPPLYERAGIIESAYLSLGCPGGERLYSLLRTRFYWKGMKRDCVVLCSVQFPSQRENRRPSVPPHLVPTEKG